MKDNSLGVFFALLRAGLWEQVGVNLNPNEKVDWEKVYQLAEEQSVIGVVLAGIEHSNVKPPQELLLQWIGEVQILEQQNKAMNLFIAELVEKMRNADIYTLLVKGQGVAQCYERPLWRSSGDVDFYLSKDNFEKAKSFFRTLVDSFDPDNDTTQHINMHYDPWVVEIHGNQHSSLSPRINRGMDEIHYSLFYGGNVRSTTIGNTMVFLPSANEDVVIVFVHFLNHFYRGGVGVRQICDWCRLLWTYRETIDLRLVEERIRKMGLMTEWKSFADFAVEYIGMPKDAMPFYSSSIRWKSKAKMISSFILDIGNFGHNRDTSYYGKYPKLICKMISMWRRFGDTIRHTRIFPIESLRFFPWEVYYGIRAAIKGE